MKDHHLGLRRHVGYIETRPTNGIAGHNLPLQLLARIENSGRRMGHRTPGADDVQVFVDARARFRVVMVQVECVGLGLLKKVDDLAILVRPLLERQTHRGGRRRRRGVSEGIGSTRRWSSRRCAGQPSCFDGERCIARHRVPKAQGDSSIRFLDHLRWNGARDNLVSQWKNDCVALDAERTAENE